MEAARQTLDDPLRRSPVAKAGPAHIATLKTFDPPLSALDGRRFAGARRRGKHLLFPTDDGELVLHVHLMSAGRIRFLEPGAKGPKDAGVPATPRGRRRADPHRGRPEEARPRRRLPAGGDRRGAGASRPGGRPDPGRGARRDRAPRGAPAASLPARPACPRRHRAGVVERDPQPREALPVRPHDRALGRGDRAPRGDDPRAPRPRPRAPPGRRRRQEGVPRPQPPRRAVPELRDAPRPRRLRGAHDLLLPRVPDRRARPQGPAPVPAPQVADAPTALKTTR